jgi:hypothetical protein
MINFPLSALMEAEHSGRGVNAATEHVIPIYVRN